MGIAPGGMIAQDIKVDHYDPKKWLEGLTFTIPVHILNTAAFRRATGIDPPPSPISAKDYALAGLPFYALLEEMPSKSNVSGAEAFAPIKSIAEIQKGRGLTKDEEEVVRPRTDGILFMGKRRAQLGWMAPGGDSNIMTDPHGLLNPDGPRCEFRTIKGLGKAFRRLGMSECT